MATQNVTEGDHVKLSIPQGATYVITFYYKDSAGAAVDLTGYTGRCQFRATVDATSTLYDSTTDGDITITAGTGAVELKIPATTTAAWTFQAAVYDLEIVASDGSVTRLVKGRVVVDPEVTR